MKDTVYKNYIIILMLTGGFLSYSNLFCVDQHLRCLNQHRPHHHDENEDSHRDFHKLLDPSHDLAHTNQQFEPKSFDPSDFVMGSFSLPDSPDTPLKYHQNDEYSFNLLETKFISQSGSIDIFLPLLI